MVNMCFFAIILNSDKYFFYYEKMINKKIKKSKWKKFIKYQFLRKWKIKFAIDWCFRFPFPKKKKMLYLNAFFCLNFGNHSYLKVTGYLACLLSAISIGSVIYFYHKFAQRERQIWAAYGFRTWQTRLRRYLSEISKLSDFQKLKSN